MRIAITILICILVSGCGLFRKKTTIKNSALIEQKSDVKESESEKTKLDVQQYQKVITLTDDKSKITTTVKGREIEVTPSGIKCKDCEFNQSKDIDLKKQVDSAAFIKSNLEYAKEAYRSAKERLKNETKNSNVVTEPSGIGIIYGTIGVMVIIFGLLWYFGIYINKYSK